MLKDYLKGQALHPHTSCGLLITQDYIQTLRLLTQQSWVDLLIMRAWIDICRFLATGYNNILYLDRPLLLFCSYLINPCMRTLFCPQAPVCRSAVSHTHPHWWASQRLSVSFQQGHPSFLSQSLDSRLHICLFSIGAFKKIWMFLNIKQSGWKIPHSNPSGVLNCWSVV